MIRVLLVTQCLALLLALAPWLENWGAPGQPSLAHALIMQSITAVLVTVGAFMADARIRQGTPVLRAFTVTLLGACLAISVVMLWLDGEARQNPALLFAAALSTFLGVVYWGMPLLVYLNRKSAARLLATVQDRELSRVQAERRLVESDLAAARAEINPESVLQKLGHLRDLYAAASPDADRELEGFITDLRETAARCAR